ncbi:MAG: DedA family protein [Candidatus Kerfeldbacteria bacterium]|nr:DedA family protein [Candidatus Kerfeldbacteria bacterium]
MNILFSIFDFVIHIDEHLSNIIAATGPTTYIIVFAIIFAETGLVVAPILPGDSLLFALGAFAARGDLSIFILWPLTTVAAILGDSVNYAIGKRIGKKAFSLNSRFIKQEHLKKTEAFYTKHGAKMIIMARFVPIVRTFAPFVAGIGNMHYRTFISYNIIGGIIWTTLFTLLGFFFGNIPAVAHNFTLVIFAIIGLSLLPPIIEWIRSKKKTVQ